jgi:F420 biosynthesis protein FbiB-like protein
MTTLAAQPVLDAIRARRSVRRYRADPPPRALIDAALEAAGWAPSAHNRQPWRFAVLATRAARERLATAMGARLQADRLADGDPPEAVARDVARSRARLTGAPWVVVACLSMADMDRYPDARRAQAERTMASQSTALALQNLLLAAHALGLGSCWLCAPLFCPDTVQATLGLPADWEPQALVTLGWPAETRTTERMPVATRVVTVD